ATRTVPIVFFTGGDPVALGWVNSLSRPGGNVTGATTLNVEVGPKRFELMRELIPSATTIGFLWYPASENAATQMTNARESARALGFDLRVLSVNGERDFEMAFATMSQLRPSGLVIGGDPFFTARFDQLSELAQRYAVPTAAQYHEFAAAGGLM